MSELDPIFESVRKTQSTRKPYRLWTDQQSFQYLRFMEQRRSLFCDEESRRANRVFKAMAEYILTRDCEQCRSHHQKMILKHKTVERLIKHLKKKTENQQKRRLQYQQTAKQQANNPHSIISSSDTMAEPVENKFTEESWERYIDCTSIHQDTDLKSDVDLWDLDEVFQF